MEFKVIKEFECHGKRMFVVKGINSCHVMPWDEWKNVYGQLHPERWENGKRVSKNRKVS